MDVNVNQEDTRYTWGEKTPRIQDNLELVAANCKKTMINRLELLAERCPLCIHPDVRSNPAACPMNPIRKLEKPDKLAWLNKLSLTDLGYLLAYHTGCIRVTVKELAKQRVADRELFLACSMFNADN